MIPKEMEKILHAFNEGKEIEVLCKKADSEVWEKTTNIFRILIAFNSLKDAVRIVKEPEYRPYKTIEEFIQDAQNHGPFIIYTVNSYSRGVVPAYEGGKYHIPTVGWITATSLLEKAVWADNTPCGVKED